MVPLELVYLGEMEAASTNPSLPGKIPSAGIVVHFCLPGQTVSSSFTDHAPDFQQEQSQRKPLQALLASLALHEQMGRRKTLDTHRSRDDGFVPEPELEERAVHSGRGVQVVADRAIAITGADGVAIALAENSGIVLHAAAGTVLSTSARISTPV